MTPTVLAFLKAPRPGFAKTRLAREVGAERAAAIYRRLALEQWQRIPAAWRAEAHFVPVDAAQEMRAWLGSRGVFQPQADGDLGAKLAAGFEDAFGRGGAPVLAIGGDCPDLDEPALERAALGLLRADVVLGPAQDGGYYLIGLNRPHPEIFQGIPWGTGEVLTTTLARAASAGLRCVLLDVKADVDDAQSWTAHLARSGSRVSVIIPTLNEETRISHAVESTRAVLPDAEILVVDGGSSDRTAARAAAAGAQVISAARGRGAQLVAGAAAAAGDWLLFLHADSTLPEEAGEVILNFMREAGRRVATFRLRFDDGGWFLDACAWFTRWDSVITRFGDQGILIEAGFYREIGGFPAWPLFEDVALLQRARRLTRIHSLPAAITTSARRFQRRGALPQQLLNGRLLGQYLLGTPPARLAEIYRASRTDNGPGTPGAPHET